jgi:hypothetical protein
MLKLSMRFLYSQRAKRVITKEIRKYFQMSEEESTKYQNTCEAAKTRLQSLNLIKRAN